MRAAIYTRYSSDNQREASLEDQERLCRQEAARLGYSVVHVYKDAALSGQLGEHGRPGFQAMLAAARREEFDVLMVDDASRLSRDAGDALKIQERLLFLGIGLVARADGINTLQNPKNSALVFGIKSVINREFLRDLGEKTWRGLEGRVRSGFSPGGLPYGYRSKPAFDAPGRIAGYRRVIHEPEAEVVRRIFRLYVGDEGGQAHSSRQIAVRLNEEGIAPPGARWKNKTVRQAATWSYTAIIGHRRLGKGVLNNPLYIGRMVWNRSEWMRDPDTKAYRYRVRPATEHVEVEVPELRIVPQDLWERAQVRLALQDVPRANGRQNVGKYLLSGFVKCAECGGSYSKKNHSYYCANHRNRGDRACSNKRGITVERLQRIVIDALRRKLYTPENLKTIIANVRDELLVRAKTGERARLAVDPVEQSRRLREVEQEIENLKAALRFGKATEIIMEMLAEAGRRRKALQTSQELPSHDDMRAKVERVLAELPERVQAHLEDLETLLARNQVGRGKDILAALGTEIAICPDGRAEIRGDLGKALVLVSGRQRESVLSWLGEEDSNPH
jgi:site-specific DNA recombinase